MEDAHGQQVGAAGRLVERLEGGDPEILAGLAADPPGIDEEDKLVAGWRSTGRWVLAASMIAWLGWMTFTRAGWTPLLSGVDLGFHELGHMLTMVLPQPLVALAGSVTQVAIPLGLFVYFWRVRSDLFAGALMLGWAGESANNVAVYIADAPVRVLPLLGGQEGHDWAYLLGPQVLNVMSSAGLVAGSVRVLAGLLLLAGLGICAAGLVAPYASAHKRREDHERLETLPMHEPRNPVLRAPDDPAGSGIGDSGA
jgi:hypothetical protein